MPTEKYRCWATLVFRFNQSLASDSLMNMWDSTDYISFEPKIAGKFRWESPDQLVFSPSQPLAPATSYKAVIKNAYSGLVNIIL
ncbi:MAG: hypothetical protein WDO16_06375 [Bacteroidota bacterium]